MLSPSDIQAAEAEIYRLDVGILAAEDWSDLYDQDPAGKTKLIKLEANMLRVLRRYFRDLGQNAHQFIDWFAYDQTLQRQINAADDFNVEVVVLEKPLHEADGVFLKIIFDEIATGAAIGAQSGETIYRRYKGFTSTTSEIQQFAREQVALLVGKRVGKDGRIEENPKAKYRISNTTREDIKESIRTSLSLGENQEAATERLRTASNNPKRAELIAQTEAVNAYQGGLLQFGKKSGAIGKESQALNTKDRCADYAKEGVVPIDYKYGGQYLGPSYHPRCRCGLRLVYPEGA